jgi:hypothetical protein
MWKDVAIVAVAAGGGQWVAGKFGAKIESKAVEMKIPPAVAHAVVVGGGAAAVYFIVKAFI